MAAYRARVLEPVPAITATGLLLQVEVLRTLPTPVSTAARALAWRVARQLGVERTLLPVAQAPRR